MTSTAPKISIGIVIYNGDKHIGHALKSIIGQPYKNIELIVVDGGSTDDTLGVLEEYSKYISVMISEPDDGIYDAMNKVCSLATGDWLIFLGCDDVLLDTFCNIPAHLCKREAVYYGDVIKKSNREKDGGEFSKYRLMHQNICHQGIFYPTTVFKEYTYSLHYKWLADYAYNLKLFGNKIEFIYTGITVSIYNDSGLSSQGDPDFSKDQIKLIRTSFGSTYALIEILRRLGFKFAALAGIVIKRLLPYSYWKYCRSLWRRLLK